MIVFDIEADGFLDKITKIHCMSYQVFEDFEATGEFDIKSTTDPEVMREILEDPENICIGHHIIGYDNKALKKVCNISVNNYVDTLPLSWTLHHSRTKGHSLKSYEGDYGELKKDIDDWENLTEEEYILRCESDVRINTHLFADLWRRLKRMYPNEEDRWRYINYLNFKMECAADQEEIGWNADVRKIEDGIHLLESLKGEKYKSLKAVMPKVPEYKVKTRPKTLVKADGSNSVHGQAWIDLCKQEGVNYLTDSIKYIADYKEPNPDSPQQVKDWLTSLGWVPRTFKYVRDKTTNETRAIPQVRKDGELCSSVEELAEEVPEVKELEGYTVINHRLAILKSFKDSLDHEGRLHATVAGLTNTLRFKHSKPLVNLPSVDKPYGDLIRSCLIANDGELLCGSDVVSLEDTTKRHYMKPLDPKYVAEMEKEGYDPHLSLAVFAGAITQSDYEQYQSYESILESGGNLTEDQGKHYKYLKGKRKAFKVVNYSATYGIRETALSRATGLSKEECTKLLDAFWAKNWAVQRVARDAKVKVFFGEQWLWNPVSRFWYSLRYEKDKFSTLNQSTGVYCFDKWMQGIRYSGIDVCGQFHDEGIFPVKYGDQPHVEKTLKGCMSDVNKELNLNVTLNVDVQFGVNYAEIH